MDTVYKFKTIEMWNVRYDNVWFELHVDVTEEPFITDLFSEHGDNGITEDVWEYMQNLVAKKLGS